MSAAYEICKCKRLHLSLLVVSTEKVVRHAKRAAVFSKNSHNPQPWNTKKAHLRLDSKQTIVYDGGLIACTIVCYANSTRCVQPPSMSAAHEICKCKRLHLSLLAVSTERRFGTQSVRLFSQKTAIIHTLGTRKKHISAWVASRQSAELWQEFLSVYELIAKIFCAVEPRKYC